MKNNNPKDRKNPETLKKELQAELESIKKKIEDVEKDIEREREKGHPLHAIYDTLNSHKARNREIESELQKMERGSQPNIEENEMEQKARSIASAGILNIRPGKDDPNAYKSKIKSMKGNKIEARPNQPRAK